jgi:hypothetical protein
MTVLPGSSPVKLPNPLTLITDALKSLVPEAPKVPKPPEPKIEPLPPPPEPPPERGDIPMPEPVPDVIGTDRKARLEERARRGRRSTILTSPGGITESAPLGRPAAKLGG